MKLTDFPLSICCNLKYERTEHLFPLSSVSLHLPVRKQTYCLVYSK